MKYQITVNNKTYEVEIENINERPVIAFVDGDRFEVMPECSNQAEAAKEADETKNKVWKKPFNPNQPSGISHTPHLALSGDTQTAPLPGTVIEVFVKAGEKVEAGQMILVIEAMKMKNSIRSVYGGTISEVLVSAGQSVAHRQALIKFTETGEAA
jgi:biotin carboxyl carrier protein